MTMKETSINSSIYYIPLIQGWVRRVKRSIRENPDNPLPSDPLQLLLGDPQALRSIRIYNPSSKFWVCPGASLPVGHARQTSKGSTLALLY